jgi:hypothetical protein
MCMTVYHPIPPKLVGKSVGWRQWEPLLTGAPRGSLGLACMRMAAVAISRSLQPIHAIGFFAAPSRAGQAARGKPYRVEVGLGSLRDIGLAEAREKAALMRKQCRAGVNPLDEKRRERQTFEQAARQLHAKEAPTWAKEPFQALAVQP